MNNAILFLLTFIVGVIFSLLLLNNDGLLVQIWINFADDIEFLIRRHVFLVVISGGLAILCAVPLGVWFSRPSMQKFAEAAMQILNVGTTVPTLAVLALSMSFLGIGVVPAIFALWVATLLPIVRNTYVGIREVPQFLIEAASGMGMTPFQILFRIELPNALYVIFAGIRTAMVINVGTVPLAFLIGAGGLGELIFTGIALDNIEMMLAGAIPVALLAMVVDFIISQIQTWSISRGVNPLR